MHEACRRLHGGGQTQHHIFGRAGAVTALGWTEEGETQGGQTPTGTVAALQALQGRTRRFLPPPSLSIPFVSGGQVRAEYLSSDGDRRPSSICSDAEVPDPGVRILFLCG